MLNVVLQQFFHQFRPNIFCSGGFGFPSRETQLAYMSLMLIIHRTVVWRDRMKLITYLSVLLLGLYVPFGVWFSGMNTVHQILAGALIGLSSGLVRVYLYKYYIFPLAPALRQFFGSEKTSEHTDNLF